MTTADVFALVLGERVDRCLGADEPFFLTHLERRHRVREVVDGELSAVQADRFSCWPAYAAVSVRRGWRTRLFFVCTLELRENLAEEEAAEIIRDLLELQQAAALAGEAH